MKIFRFLAVALVATLGFTACEKHECDFIEVDHSADLVGTWTYLSANYAEALVIKADGSVVSTGVEDGEYWDGVKGNIKTVNNKMTLTFEDGDNYEGRFEMIAGEAFTIFNEEGEHMTYRYCANDLSDEIIGMWVCNDTPADGESEMMINTFYENGKSVLTGFLPLGVGSEQVVNNQTDYKVVGDLLFITIPADRVGGEKPMYIARQIIYTPNATAMGDIMTRKTIKGTSSWLRIKQSLDLEGKKYDYIKTFVTNVKGLDKDINFMGFEFNFAKMDGVKLDKMLKTLLFAVEFPTADSIKYSCHYNGEYMALTAPIAVDGNKMTVKMSDKDAAYKDVDLYTFQDADCSQMHMYMPTYAFINFFGNMQATMMSQMGQLDLTNAEAVKAVFDSIDEAVETINVSFVMEKAAK